MSKQKNVLPQTFFHSWGEVLLSLVFDTKRSLKKPISKALSLCRFFSNWKTIYWNIRT